MQNHFTEERSCEDCQAENTLLRTRVPVQQAKHLIFQSVTHGRKFEASEQGGLRFRNTNEYTYILHILCSTTLKSVSGLTRWFQWGETGDKTILVLRCSDVLSFFATEVMQRGILLLQNRVRPTRWLHRVCRSAGEICLRSFRCCFSMFFTWMETCSDKLPQRSTKFTAFVEILSLLHVFFVEFPTFHRAAEFNSQYPIVTAIISLLRNLFLTRVGRCWRWGFGVPFARTHVRVHPWALNLVAELSLSQSHYMFPSSAEHFDLPVMLIGHY